MKNLYKSLKKLPDVTREIVTIRSNGKKKIVTKTITNRYLLELENGNSIAVTEKDLKDFGINDQSINKSTQVVTKHSTIVEQLEEIEDNIPEIDEDLDDIVEDGEQNSETVA